MENEEINKKIEEFENMKTKVYKDLNSILDKTANIELLKEMEKRGYSELVKGLSNTTINMLSIDFSDFGILNEDQKAELEEIREQITDRMYDIINGKIYGTKLSLDERRMKNQYEEYQYNNADEEILNEGIEQYHELLECNNEYNNEQKYLKELEDSKSQENGRKSDLEKQLNLLQEQFAKFSEEDFRIGISEDGRQIALNPLAYQVQSKISDIHRELESIDGSIKIRDESIQDAKQKLNAIEEKRKQIFEKAKEISKEINRQNGKENKEEENVQESENEKEQEDKYKMTGKYAEKEDKLNEKLKEVNNSINELMPNLRGTDDFMQKQLLAIQKYDLWTKKENLETQLKQNRLNASIENLQQLRMDKKISVVECGREKTNLDNLKKMLNNLSEYSIMTNDILKLGCEEIILNKKMEDGEITQEEYEIKLAENSEKRADYENFQEDYRIWYADAKKEYLTKKARMLLNDGKITYDEYMTTIEKAEKNSSEIGDGTNFNYENELSELENLINESQEKYLKENTINTKDRIEIEPEKISIEAKESAKFTVEQTRNQTIPNIVNNGKDKSNFVLNRLESKMKEYLVDEREIGTQDEPNKENDENEL